MNRIKELRAEKGLTQTDLAEYLGVNQTAAGKYERGDLEPNLSVLIKLSRLFEVSVDYIIGNSDDLGVISIANEKSSSLAKDEQSVLNAYRALPEDLQRRARVYIEKLAELVAAEQSPVRPFRA